jgi:hypothetical protein
MKILAIANVQLAGYGIVRRGTVIDYAKDKIDERIAANFLNAADETRLKVSKKAQSVNQPELINKTKEELLAEQEAKRIEERKELLEKLGEEGVKEQLAEFSIPFNSEMSIEKLCDLLLDRIGE